MSEEGQIDRAMKIVAEFCAWTDETGKCPINPWTDPWFKRLASMAYRIAEMEATLRAIANDKNTPAYIQTLASATAVKGA